MSKNNQTIESPLNVAAMEADALRYDVGALVDLLKMGSETDLEYFLYRYLEASARRLETVCEAIELAEEAARAEVPTSLHPVERVVRAAVAR